jgi:hypothetical protein
MCKPIRIQRKRIKGYDMQAESLSKNGLPAVSVTRPGKWGNPFKVGEMIWDPRCETMSLVVPQTVNECVKLYEIYIRNGLKVEYETWIKKDIHELKGKNLACFCKEGEACHADVLLELAN